MGEQQELNNHEKFKELGALANSGTLTASEWAELKVHLRNCEHCHESYNQYRILAGEGLPSVAASRCSQQDGQDSWDSMATYRKLFARVHTRKQHGIFRHDLLRRIPTNPLACASLAACLIIALGLVAYSFGRRTHDIARQPGASVGERLQNLEVGESNTVDELRDADAKKIVLLQQEILRTEKERAKMQSALRTLKNSEDELLEAKNATDQQLVAAVEKRDALISQLRDADQAYRDAKVELANLRSERDKEFQRAASLESKIDELSVSNRDQDRRLKDAEQYLASDRDIRELMGARKLYIADVFDVDSHSRTQKPFGRVFYTQGKSLIFYAFDLDSQRGINKASTFQAWGRIETSLGTPLNMGILYMDNESNRRWVLRFDEPRQLAEIDAVFVTVEPHGGSQKPTGKPFLYALLKKEANHP